MDFTGTRGMKEKPIRGLSKGMKQRVCLGRAMIHDPSVMILDEPAAGLDPITGPIASDDPSSRIKR